jgi:hypothetical protein
MTAKTMISGSGSFNTDARSRAQVTLPHRFAILK